MNIKTKKSQDTWEHFDTITTHNDHNQIAS